jgi:hypothetical protein
MRDIDINPILEKYFQFDKIFNLRNYGVSLARLRDDLLPLCKDRYENNYRFIFLHYDTDYHVTNDQPGLILRNLQRIVKSLDIDNYFCLILSQKDLQHDLDLISQQETADTCSMFCLTHPLQKQTHFKKLDKVDHAVDSIIYKYICLNRIKRFHRIVLYALLKKQNLLDHGAVSFGSRL